MFRILITFKNHESLLFTSKHFSSLGEIEQRFSNPLPWTFQSQKGPIVVTRSDVDLIAIQKINGHRIIEHRTIIFKEDIRMAEEKKVLEPEVIEDEPELEVKPKNNVPSLYHKHISFRDTLLKGSIEGESWQDSIIEKQARYNKALKEIDSIMTERETNATALRDKLLGK